LLYVLCSTWLFNVAMYINVLYIDIGVKFDTVLISIDTDLREFKCRKIHYCSPINSST
jgi:hypothetical protein